MPILPEEPAIFPDTLLEDNSEPNPDKKWCVLHTRPRQEKSVARELLSIAVSFYLPLVEHRQVTNGRIFKSWKPLFASYVFLLADREDRLRALKTQRLVKVLDVSDQAELWRDLRQLYKLIATGMPITPEERLVPGMEVEISSGALAGLQGTVMRSVSGRRFVVKVNFLQRGASVLLDDFALTPLK